MVSGNVGWDGIGRDGIGEMRLGWADAPRQGRVWSGLGFEEIRYDGIG